MEECHPMTDLEAAVRAFDVAKREAEEARIRAASEALAAKAKVDQARAALAEAIVTAVREGSRVTDVASLTGYSREQVRRIVRASGLET